MKKQDFTVLKIEDLRPFPDNPFRLVEDELLMEIAACPCLTACRDRDNPCFCFALRP